jgi:hypothetical protein
MILKLSFLKGKGGFGSSTTFGPQVCHHAMALLLPRVRQVQTNYTNEQKGGKLTSKQSIDGPFLWARPLGCSSGGCTQTTSKMNKKT